MTLTKQSWSIYSFFWSITNKNKYNEYLHIIITSLLFDQDIFWYIMIDVYISIFETISLIILTNMNRLYLKDTNLLFFVFTNV